MENSVKRAVVILGAGASYDVSHPEAVLNRELRPPLATDLFGRRAYEGPFWSVLERYPGAVLIQQLLYRKSAAGSINLEAELRRYQSSENEQYSKAFKHVPPYLRDLLEDVSMRYTRAPGAYSELIAQLVAETSHEVVFIVLNYDTFLEQAISGYDPQYTYQSLGDYLRPERAIKVAKIHGSINWAAPISAVSQSWDQAIIDLDPARIDLDSVVVRNSSQPVSSWSVGASRWYPVLTAPVVGKTDADICLPEAQRQTLIDFVSDCHKFLIVGNSGQDADLLAFLGSHVREPETIHYVAKGDVPDIKQRFEVGVPRFKRPGDTAGLFTRGFAEYIESGGLRVFAEA